MEPNRRSRATLDARSEMARRLRGAPPPPDTAVKKIAFPEGLAPVPRPLAAPPRPDDSLPPCDVIAMMDTVAEARAMANVLTPGHAETDFYPYARNFEKRFLPLIGPRGPSRESRRLGSYFPVDIA